MEPWTQLRRRSTGLWASVHQSLPAMPRLRRPSSAAVGASWQPISGLPPLPRSSHSLDVVAGAAYVFGGELTRGELVANDMLVVSLPYSSAGADYYHVEAKAAAAAVDDAPREEEEELELERQPEQRVPRDGDDQRGLQDVPLEETDDAPPVDKGKQPATVVERPPPPADDAAAADVPSPRAGHATAVIGARIFLFGGRGGVDAAPLDEAGRVWVFDTRSRTWSHLDPVAPVASPVVGVVAPVPHPAARSHHCAAATEHPRNAGPAPSSRAPQTWRQWAVGDAARAGIPQDPVVGHVAEAAVDVESDGYGTFLIHGGCLVDGERAADVWAFDVAARTWTELPAAPGPPRAGSAMSISKSRLFRFGGSDGAAPVGRRLDFLPLELETFDDAAAKAEVFVAARPRGWQTIVADDAAASSPDIPAEPEQPWPPARSVAALHALAVGRGGREFLVLAMGEAAPDPDGAPAYLDDVWTFQVPPLGMSPASLTDAVLQAVGRKTGEGVWTRVATRPFDDDDEAAAPAPRGWLASAPMGDVDESAIVMWGGLGTDDGRLGDGWILRLGD